MEFWQHIYEHFDPVAFSLFGFKLHWYGLMYVLALLIALWAGAYFVKKDRLDISKSELESYFFWAEIGVILGARLGYVFIYSTTPLYYLSQPWQIFNPFVNGEFVGISGMSYHGAVLGFLLATYLFCKKYKKNIWLFLDLGAISIPLGYIFGRVGNFLNQELVGRATDLPWGIYVDGVLRHPSQLYEAVLEGLVIFIIIFTYKKRKKFQGELICLYAILYTLARFVCEYFRQPDPQLGFLIFGLSMGQILSIFMFFFALCVYFRNIAKLKIF